MQVNLARLRLLSLITAISLLVIGIATLAIGLLEGASLIAPLLALSGFIALLVLEIVLRSLPHARTAPEEQGSPIEPPQEGRRTPLPRLSDWRTQPSLIENKDEHQRYSDQLAILEVEILSDPSSAVLHRERARILSLLGRQGEALKAVETAIVLKPDLVEAHCTRSHILLEIGDHDGALAAAERTLELEQDDPCAEMNRSWALSRLGRFDEALAAASRAVYLAEDDEEAHRVMAEALDGLDRPGDALQAIDRALAIRRTNRGVAMRDQLRRRLR